MTDPLKSVKDAYYTLLGSGIAVNGTSIPCYIAEGEITSNNAYMVISGIRSDSEQNKHKFIHVVDVDIDIYYVSIPKSADLFSQVDSIAQQIFDKVIISQTETGLNFVGFDLVKMVYYTNTTTQPLELNPERRVIRRTITFRNTITE